MRRGCKTSSALLAPRARRGYDFGLLPEKLPKDPELGELTEDRLTRDFTLFQRAKGHRFSSDDMITAYVAVRHARPDARVLDMGTGIGSVLLHLAWSLPESTLVGVEAQPVSFGLLVRNVTRNGLDERVRVHHGDLRTVVPALAERFDLVTGTPPYFPPDTALDAMDGQRAYARIEYRGGIDDYVPAGATVLADEGVLVLCGAFGTESRLESAASEVGLHVVARTAIIARAPKPPLFAVWVLAHAAAPCVHDEVILRDENGESTEHARMLRRFSGF